MPIFVLCEFSRYVWRRTEALVMEADNSIHSDAMHRNTLLQMTAVGPQSRDSEFVFQEKTDMIKSNEIFKLLMWLFTLLPVVIVTGCGGGSSTAVRTSPVTPSAKVGSVCSGPGCIALGNAANFTILSKTGVSTVPSSVVNGNVGVSPATRSFLSGWSLISEPTDTEFNSAQVVGSLYAADNMGGTTSVSLTTAVEDMQAAYAAAEGKAGGSCPGAGDLGGLTIAPGIYTCTNALTITASVILNGTATDVWIFQLAQGLTQADATQVILTGGALPQNVFWQVAGAVDIGATALMQGVILSQTAINLQAGATLNGRLLSQAEVTLNQSTVRP